MKSTLILLFSFLISAQAFAPPVAFTRSTAVFAGPEEEEEGLDLNLEEMFDMFDAADKEEDFEKALKKVKKEE